MKLLDTKEGRKKIAIALGVVLLICFVIQIVSLFDLYSCAGIDTDTCSNDELDTKSLIIKGSVWVTYATFALLAALAVVEIIKTRKK